MIKGFTQPPTYQVYVTYTTEAEPKQPYTARVATTNDPKKIPTLIADDLRAMGNTFGGLFDPTSTKGRRYRVFKAEWSEMTEFDKTY
jgi:hypothetical protein